jgi:hypothetical protein
MLRAPATGYFISVLNQIVLVNKEFFSGLYRVDQSEALLPLP